MSERTTWEDYEIGAVYSSPPRELTEGEIIEFAGRFDPQPFHLDPTEAANSIYGGLIASGWHMASLCFRLFIDSGVFGDGHVSLGAPGVEELLWLRPGRPGDQLCTVATIVDKFPHEHNSSIGFVRIRFELRNQKEEIILSMYSNLMLRRKKE